jgi:hypothetical protein
MEWLLEVRPIRLFSFYLMAIFTISTLLRLNQYRTVVALVSRLHNRWPNLTRLVLAHRHILVNWTALRPQVFMLVLLVVNVLANRFIWPLSDNMRLNELLALWPMIPLLTLAGLGMLGLDLYNTFRVGQIDQKLLEGYFDQAEFWLRGWKAPVVNWLSLGYVNPRQIVTKEVSAALEKAAELLHSTALWVSAQTALRFLFGLLLWLSYACQAWLRELSG